MIAPRMQVQPVNPDRIQLIPARSGCSNVEIEGFTYHSPYDPVREARLFYTGLPLEKVDVLVHFGWGLGYGGSHLKERLSPTARVFVLEPNPEIFDLYRSGEEHRKLGGDSRFQFVVGPHVRQFIDDWGLDGCQDTDRILWVGWPRAEQYYPELSDSLQQALRTRLRDRAGNLLTHFQNGRLYFENALDNLIHAPDPSVGRLFGRFRGVPLVLVSAGPSLDRNIRQLRGMEDRCFLLSVDTALRPLLASGIRPHAVMIADPSELNSRHVSGVIPSDTYLIAERGVHPSAMQSAAQRFQFSVGVFPDSLYAEFGLERTTLEVWGSVSTAALDLACHMGSDPIIFLGQDFAYTWGRDYASNTIFAGRPFDDKTSDRSGTDIWGREVPTTENLVAYRDFFVRRMAQETSARFINATEGGILTAGVEIVSLNEAFCRLDSGPVHVRDVLGALHERQTVSHDLASHLNEVFRNESRDCRCLQDFLDLVARKAVLEEDPAAIQECIRWAAGLTGPRSKVSGRCHRSAGRKLQGSETSSGVNTVARVRPGLSIPTTDGPQLRHH